MVPRRQGSALPQIRRQARGIPHVRREQVFVGGDGGSRHYLICGELAKQQTRRVLFDDAQDVIDALYAAILN